MASRPRGRSCTQALAAPDKGHVTSHQSHELDVGGQRKAGTPLSASLMGVAPLARRRQGTSKPEERLQTFGGHLMFEPISVPLCYLLDRRSDSSVVKGEGGWRP
jgi:hypothetical protein